MAVSSIKFQSGQGLVPSRKEKATRMRGSDRSRVISLLFASVNLKVTRDSSKTVTKARSGVVTMCAMCMTIPSR